MIKTVTLGTSLTEYELTRKRVKNINLRITPDGTIKVSAPPRVSEKTIESFIISKEHFILKALEKSAAKDRIRPVSFSEGEVFTALGEKCALHFELGRKKPQRSDGILTLFVKDDTSESRKKAYEKWERECAETLTVPYIEKALADFASFGIPTPVIKYRRMVSRWGSCQTRDAVITLNIFLSALPPECAEYVVYHEFTHLLEANHSDAFYGKLSVFIPDWKQRRNKMKKYSAVGR